MKLYLDHSWNHKKTLGRMLLLFTIVLFWVTPSVVSAFGTPKRVLLRDVQTLTLHRGKMTTGRRTSPVLQVSCIGGNACGDFEPDVVQCTNAGFDGSDVQWKCNADLPDNLRFGQLEVYCEGYNHPDDPYVLKGSCGLEYKLYYTNIRPNDGAWGQPHFSEWAARAKRQSWMDSLYFMTWFSLVGFILCSFVKSCLQQPRGGRDDPPPPYRASGSGGHGGGGGGGDGGGWGSGWGNGPRPKPTDGSSSSEGYRPGFWSGLGLGGMAAYLAANRDRRDYGGRGYRQSTYGAGPSTWASYEQPTSFGSFSSGAGPSSSSSSSSSSRPSRSATGYGSTRRR